MRQYPLFFIICAFFYVFGKKINNKLDAFNDFSITNIIYIIAAFMLLCIVIRVLRNIYIWFSRFSHPIQEDNEKENYEEFTPPPPRSYVENSPYQILGLDENASNDEIKNKWKSLVKEHHPDNLASKNLPQAYIDLGNKLMSDINNAYETIAKERNLK